MKLILMRHAQAQEEIEDDFVRPITPEGKEEHKKVVVYLEKKYGIQRILSSPLKRAQESAQIVLETYPTAQFEIENALGYVFDSYSILHSLKKEKVECQLLLGHAPTLGLLATSLLKEVRGSIHLPKSGFLVIHFDELGFGRGLLEAKGDPKGLVF